MNNLIFFKILVIILSIYYVNSEINIYNLYEKSGIVGINSGGGSLPSVELLGNSKWTGNGRIYGVDMKYDDVNNPLSMISIDGSNGNIWDNATVSSNFEVWFTINGLAREQSIMEFSSSVPGNSPGQNNRNRPWDVYSSRKFDCSWVAGEYDYSLHGYFMGEELFDNDRFVWSNGAVRGLEWECSVYNNRVFWPDDSLYEKNIDGDDKLKLGDMYHFAYVYDVTKKEGDVYINGVLQPRIINNPTHNDYSPWSENINFGLARYLIFGNGEFDGSIYKITVELNETPWTPAQVTTRFSDPPNSPPFVNNVTVAFYGDNETTIDLSTIVDPEGHNYTCIINQPTKGSVSGGIDDSSYPFVHDPKIHTLQFKGGYSDIPADIPFTCTDSRGAVSDTFTIKMVFEENDDPIPTNSSMPYKIGSGALPVLLQVTDSEGDVLSLQLDTIPALGQLLRKNATHYVPMDLKPFTINEIYFNASKLSDLAAGSTSFQFRAKDKYMPAFSAPATLTIEFTSPLMTVGNEVVVEEDVRTPMGNVWDNRHFNDPLGELTSVDQLTFYIDSLPDSGGKFYRGEVLVTSEMLPLKASEVDYLSLPNVNGFAKDHFYAFFTALDGNVSSSRAQQTVSITSTPDAPEIKLISAQPFSVTTDITKPLSIAMEVSDNDTSSRPTVTIALREIAGEWSIPLLFKIAYDKIEGDIECTSTNCFQLAQNMIFQGSIADVNLALSNVKFYGQKESVNEVSVTVSDAGGSNPLLFNITVKKNYIQLSSTSTTNGPVNTIPPTTSGISSTINIMFILCILLITLLF